MTLRFKAVLAASLALVAAPAGAATIVNPVGVTVQTLAANANLNNNSLAGTVYLFDEGVKNGVQSFLLHYDRRLLDNRFSNGSFGIQLNAGETFVLPFAGTTAELNATDPSSTVIYSNSVLRGLEPSALILYGDTVTAATNPIVVTFNLDTAIGSLDEARFFVRQAAVPEPATWAMMIVGFALSGVALRRTRNTGRLRVA